MHHDKKIFTIMGRKRNQGKARKAAKAKAREEAEESVRNNNQPTTTTTNGPVVQPLLSAQMLTAAGLACTHGFIFSLPSIEFASAFEKSFNEAIESGDRRSFSDGLVEAKVASMDKYADVWEDSTKLKAAISYLLYIGTDAILGKNDLAKLFAAFARYFEQYIAVKLKQDQALFNFTKIEDVYYSDDHTLVKFFRHRIPCSCLDEKYQEVEHIKKLGYCYNYPQCNYFPKGDVERSNTMYCSRCRNATYCSRECQEADWSRHKPVCDNNAAVIAKFESEQQNL